MARGVATVVKCKFALVVAFAATAAVVTPLASAHVDSPYRSTDPVIQEKLDGILRGKILTTPGSGGSDGFYVDSVKLPEQDLLADAKAGSATAKRKGRGLWLSRIRAGMMPPLRWIGALGLGATAFEVGWRIGSAGDRWLEISGPIGVRPSGTNELGAFAQWELEPLSSGYDAPAECAWNGTFTFDNTCFVLNIATDNHGVLTGAAIDCSTDNWADCVGSVDTQEWVDTYQSMYAYMQSIPVGTIVFRETSCGGDCVRTEASKILTETEAESKLYPTGWAAYSGQPSVATTGVPNELNPADHYYIPFSRTAGQDEVDTDPSHGTEEWINERLDEDYVSPALNFTMPDCVGFDFAICLDEISLTPHTGTITLEQLTFETADPTMAGWAVVTQSPNIGTYPRGTAIILEHNPHPDDMPMILPQPLPHETYAQYLVRLQELGYVGTATETALPEEYADPSRGPGEVVTTEPAPPGTRIRKDDPVTVRVNPPGVPAGGLPGPHCTCPSNSLNFGPITSVNYGDNFPFGIFTMVAGIIGAFNVSADAPNWTFDLSDNGDTFTLGGDGDFTIDLVWFDSYMGIIRTMISWVLWIGALWFFGTRLLGFKTAGDPQEAADAALPDD